MARGIGVGDHAPDFTLPSQSGEPVRLSDRLGERVVVLYFYPKDNTPGCTAEACAFRDSHEVFSRGRGRGDRGQFGLRRSARCLRRPAQPAVHAAQRRRADASGRVTECRRCSASMPGRVTYVIDRQGEVRHVFNSMTNIAQHVGRRAWSGGSRPSSVARPADPADPARCAYQRFVPATKTRLLRPPGFPGLPPVICGRVVHKMVDNLRLTADNHPLSVDRVWIGKNSP